MLKGKITNKEVKRENRRRVYRYMCKKGITSNPEISYELKLSLQTVTQNTREFLERGLIKELGELDSTGGRKAKALSVTADYKFVIGVDITKNHIELVLTNMIGERIEHERIRYLFRKSENCFQDINKRIEEFIEKCGVDKGKILGIGIAIPGIIDFDKKQIMDSYTLDLKNIPFDEIEKSFSFPCIFLNDANAGAFAERMQSEEEKHFFYLSLSNTVGGALYTEDKLINGNKFRCGEAGHMTIVPDGELCYCGKRGCLDSYCSAKRLSDLCEGKLEDFFEELGRDNEEIKNIWEMYMKYLTIAINNLHMVLDCDIILGGYVGSYLEDYIEEIRRMVSERNTFLESSQFVKLCKYKTGAAAMGAALYLIEKFINQI